MSPGATTSGRNLPALDRTLGHSPARLDPWFAVQPGADKRRLTEHQGKELAGRWQNTGFAPQLGPNIQTLLGRPHVFRLESTHEALGEIELNVLPKGRTMR